MASASAKVGHVLAKLLGIKLQDPEPFVEDVTRGESVFSTQTTETFVEQQPTTAEFLLDLLPTRRKMIDYVWSLFPFLHWIGHYNVQWLIGDLVAGITVGAVVVPQGMAYAILANLPPQFGLYSSFMGVLIYWFFATSKDITIGPVAVMSQLTGGVVTDMATALPEYPGYVIASALAILAGSIIVFIGLVRCGWIVDLISLVSLSAYMTGSAINIAVGQLPGLMGITGFSTRDAPYLVFIHWLQGLPRTGPDAYMGLTALAMLYIIRSVCSYSAKRWRQHQRIFFFLSTLRTVFVILLYTMISWLVYRRLPPKVTTFKILGTVPRGFQYAAVPVLNQRIASSLVSYLPATVIVLLIEHMAISKSFGRINNYTINPSQEMVAIGVANLLGPFLGAYPATGSFSRTAIKSKAGVRTPFAGVITALVVLLAIYALPAVFYYIPNASLAAVIIHAVGDLITSPNTVYRFWRASPFEVFIFFVGVIVIVFSTIENGIYCTICMSAAMLLYRILRAQGRFLGRVKVHSVLGDHVIGDDHRQDYGEYGTFLGPEQQPPEIAARSVFLPIDHGDGSNPEVALDSPYPGVFVYRFSEGFSFPNATHSLEYLTRYIFAHTRRTNLGHYERPGDRPWNEPGPTRGQRRAAVAAGLDEAAAGEDLSLPTLKAVILDFSSVNNVDITSVQQLIDVRNQLDRYASPDVVDWHLVSITNRWTKRALVSAGFGYPTPDPDGLHHRWRSIFSVAEIGGASSAAAAAESEENEKEQQSSAHVRRRSAAARSSGGRDVETASSSNEEDISEQKIAEATTSRSGGEDENNNIHKRTPAASRAVAVHGLNRPFFHVDLTSALQSAITNIEWRGAEEGRAGGSAAGGENRRSR